MRAGICIVQQALTVEAASMVKQSISLARRRGHAQVTPLHVASAMLASPTGLLRRACLQCHSHPLQCKALELCFNVALNRLPASTPSSILGTGGPHYSNNPCFSNALVAAFKRAQAHQRRGSVENQQQPILALKIELEQLIVSILDDPSVSRVMREAGFSSPQVKSRVEQAVSVSLDIISSTQISPSSQSKDSSAKQPLELIGTHHHVSSPPALGEQKHFDQTRHEDVMSVLREMLNKKIRNIVVVGECLATAEGVARGVMDKFERGNIINTAQDQGDLRYVKFICVPLYSLRNISREELEEKFAELRSLIKSYIGRGNVVLYLGDLMWVSEFWSNYAEQKRNCFSHNLEQIIMELKRLVSRIGEDGRLSLMGIATFQTYMRCKTGQPSLEKIWDLHPVAVPVGSLSLSLNSDSYLQADMSTMAPKDQSDQVSTTSTISSLPLWLQKCREENRNNDKECIEVNNICNKWNFLCSPAPQKHPHYPDKLTFNSSSKSLTSSKPLSSHDCNLNLHFKDDEPKDSPKEYQFWGFEDNDDDCYEHQNETKPDLLSNPNSSPNSASSSEVMEDMDDVLGRFKEFNAENVKLLCEEIEDKVPWQKEIIPEIATTILKCRSGMSQRKGNLKHKEDKEESWLFFLGFDSKGKEKIARELARLVFGSQNNFVSIGLSSFSSPRVDSTEEYSKNKRARNEFGCSYVQRFGEALNENPHRVFFVEDLEQVDYSSQKGITYAIQSGRITLADGETHVPLKDAIVIFSSESFSSVSTACSPARSRKSDEVTKEKEDDHNLEEKIPCVSLDLNLTIEDDNEEELSDADYAILEAVDRQILFKTQESQ
ncbi:hypothetical protein CerSpe_072160 [Prunus speciosa]